MLRAYIAAAFLATIAGTVVLWPVLGAISLLVAPFVGALAILATAIITTVTEPTP